MSKGQEPIKLASTHLKIIWILSFSRIVSVLLCNARSYDGVQRTAVSHMLMISWYNQEF